MAETAHGASDNGTPNTGTTADAASERSSQAWKARLLLGHKSMITTTLNLANPRTILPYLCTALGGATFVAGILTPIFQISSLVGSSLFARSLPGKAKTTSFCFSAA
ncbi:hypothetical protein [Roseibium sp. RKSG952]|uniref:hypothetical protein n=1 Tax=Roseibium sp. RKSG952 TaxID=2529384 RepID=UPI0012BD6331|nr:hypothetical protein [Roseibium sp. RKSG952]MTH96343.1 hypothetical protein [Roseibium sp. RKSG952]